MSEMLSVCSGSVERHDAVFTLSMQCGSLSTKYPSTPRAGESVCVATAASSHAPFWICCSVMWVVVWRMLTLASSGPPESEAS